MDRHLAATKAAELHKLGYCALESVHTETETAEQESLLYNEWEGRGSPELTGFGLGIHPLHQHVPGIARFFDCPQVNEVLNVAFRDNPRLCHTGARIANEDSSANIGWHHHYGWDTEHITGRQKIERVVVNFYVKGASPSIGSLWAIPRTCDAPIPQPLADPCQDWPGQVPLSVPPGSAVILDTALYHTATRGDSPGMRYHWGGHYQAWSDGRIHGEDMDMTLLQENRVLLEKHPGLRDLLLRP